MHNQERSRRKEGTMMKVKSRGALAEGVTLGVTSGKVAIRKWLKHPTDGGHRKHLFFGQGDTALSRAIVGIGS